VILAALMMSLSAASFAGVFIGVSVHIGPPPLPVYAQPVCPGPGYMWTPGYWAWNDVGGYYWVPGTWVVAPVGMLWTPGYWGFVGGVYSWHAGYWGPHVGFYGGINYGFGYGGVGFVGGEWRGGAFFYNRAVTNINVVHVTNVYNKTVIVNNNNHFAFNGVGGVNVRPTSEEARYAAEPHTAALAAQEQHERAASENRASFASENHGRPAIAATGRPGEFSGHGVVAAHAAGAPYQAPRMSPQEARVSSNEGRNLNEGRNNESRPQSREYSGQAHQQEVRQQQGHQQHAQQNQHHESAPKEHGGHEGRGPGR
jgi:WXXGXW repeat (2 copies)